MAVLANQTVSLRLVLNNGTTETGRVKQLSIDAAGGQEMKSTANYSPSYDVFSAVKALYSQSEISRKRIEEGDLVNS